MILIITLVIELLIFALLGAAGIDTIPDPAAFVMIGVFTAVFIPYINKRKSYRKFFAPLTVGYLWRLGLLFIDLYARNIIALPNSGGDTEMFFTQAVKFSQQPDTGGQFMVLLTGTYFRLFGVSRVFCQFLLMLCTMVALMFAVRILTELSVDIKKARLVMWILALIPNFAIISVLFLRESPIIMLETLSFYFIVLWTTRKKEKYFAMAIAFPIIAMLLHSAAVSVATGYLAVRVLYDNRSEKMRMTAKSLAVTVAIMLAGAFLFVRFGSNLLGKFSRLDGISSIASGLGAGGSSYARYVGNSSSILNMIIYTIPRMLFFQFSPMPWMIRGLSDIIAFLFSSCFYLFTVVSVIDYFARGDKEYRIYVIILAVAVLCTTFVFGWGTTNAGTAARHRDKIVVLWGILLALTMRRPRGKRIMRV